MRSSSQGSPSSQRLQASQTNYPPAPHSAVDDKILWWLVRYPLQSVEDLTLALGVSAKTIYRHLAHLTDEKLIECVTPSLGIKRTCRLYYLNDAGILAAASKEHTNARALAQSWNAHEQGLLHLLPRLSALVCLQTLVNGLIMQAPAMLTYSGGRRADFTWYWIRDYRHSLFFQGDSVICSADAALLLRRASPQPAPGSGTGDAEYYSALLYLDPGYTGSHDHFLIAQKLEAILRYRDTLLREQHIRQFPPVLVIVPTPRQRERWQQSAIEVAASPHTEPLLGAIVSLPLQEVPHSVWTLPWQKLMAQAPCRLQELFVPLPRAALPPGLLKPRGSGAAVAAAKGRRILRGNFTDRAREMSLAPQSHRQESTAIALLRLCLLQRHLDVLDLLYAHPLLATSELAILLDLQIDSVARYLFELRRYACIEKYDAVRETRWHLSPRGLRFITAMHACTLQDIAEYARETPGETLIQRGVLRLKKHIQRTAGVYAFFTALCQGARTQGADHRLLWWEIGARCAHRYFYHDAWHTLRPGAFFAYQAGDKRLVAWLEWYEDGVSQQQLDARVQEYAHYVRAREWAASGLQTLPMLLIVASEKSCYQRVIQAVTEHLANTGLSIRLAAPSAVARRGPFAAIWTQITPAPSRGVDKARKLALLDLGALQLTRPRQH